jgi:hypothetical protein
LKGFHIWRGTRVNRFNFRLRFVDQALRDEDLAYIADYHHVCLNLKLAKKSLEKILSPEKP